MKRMIPILLLLAVLFAGCHAKTRKTDSLQMVFFDVGQGDSTLFRTEAGDVLLDAGAENAQETLCRKLRDCGVKKLALLILSHPDEDHIGGADAVLESFPTDLVLTNGVMPDDESNERLRGTADRLGVPLRAAKTGDTFRFGSAVFSVLYPDEETERTAGNRAGLVVRVQYGEVSVLMMGDAERETEQKLLDLGAAHLQANILHVGHHGSQTSSGEDFLSAVHPDYAVISCGVGNSYGHPDGRTIARLSGVGAVILRTDLSGDISIRTDGKEIFENDGKR